MQIMADIPNWCEKDLPPTGLSLGLTLLVAGLLVIVAGFCLLQWSRQTLVAGLVVAASIGVFSGADQASAATSISCPTGYHVFPKSAVASLRFDGALSYLDNTDSEFTLDLNLNGGPVYQPFAVEVDGTAFALRSLFTPSPRVSSGDGWTVKVAPRDANTDSYRLVLTYTPKAATTTVPPVTVKFDINSIDLVAGGTWSMSAKVTGIPANAPTASAGYPLALYDTDAPCGSTFVTTYSATVQEGLKVVVYSEPFGGTAPYTFTATGLSGYKLATDGTITYVDAKPDSDADFMVTITDAAGATLTVPGKVAYSADFIYIPPVC